MGGPNHLHPSSRSRNQPGPAMSAPSASARRLRARSADTRVTWLGESAVAAMSVSSPAPRAWTTVTPPAEPASTPRHAAPSRTTTVDSPSRPAAAAARTRSTNPRADPGRSRHHPVGREPITFAASTRSTTPVLSNQWPGTGPGAAPQNNGSHRSPFSSFCRTHP
jgi:hypothetical protein